MFYIPSLNQEVGNDYLIERGIPLDDVYSQNLCGIYPLLAEIPQYDFTFEYLAGSTYKELGHYYIRTNEVITYTPEQLKNVLAGKKYRPDFNAAFAAIDAKANRGNRGAVLALYDAISEGADPNAPQVIVDVGIIWELEQVAEENRKLLAELEAMTIPDNATLEEAQDIIRAAIAVKPWLPWETPPPPAPPVQAEPDLPPVVEPTTIK